MTEDWSVVEKTTTVSSLTDGSRPCTVDTSTTNIPSHEVTPHHSSNIFVNCDNILAYPMGCLSLFLLLIYSFQFRSAFNYGQPSQLLLRFFPPVTVNFVL